VVSDPLFTAVLNRAEALRSEEHPKVESVVRFVKQGLREDPGSRVIVFTHFRDTATTVHDRLKGFEPQGIRPVRFVGQATRGSDSGLTQKEQKGLLQEYREGRYNVLIATSVAEEGLDIPGADLVIFFEPIPSEIRTIQRRGRTGRHSAGKVIVLMSKETRDIAYSWSAKDKEDRMERQLLSLRRMLAKAPLEKRRPRSQEERPPVTLDSFRPELQDRSSGPMTISADQREMVSSVVEELVRKGANVRPVRSGEGDYIVSDRSAIERKSAQDLADSLVDGRLFDQVARLRERYDRPVLLVEGDDPFTKRNITREAMMGAIASISIDFGIPVVFTRDPAMTAEYIIAAAKRESDRGERHRVSRTPKGGDLRMVQERIVSSLPGVSSVLAGRLLDRFGSVERIFSASEEELSTVEGIGPRKAKEIRGTITQIGIGGGGNGTDNTESG
jgi:Fanconi anemia group M protein